MKTISLKDVWLKYRIDFKENGKVVSEDFWALREINMDVDQSEAIFIIGENGAGKTTLLKIIAGMLNPDKGIVKVNGTVSALLEIGAGFQRDLTGRENIYLTSSFFGLTREQADARYPDIVKFASIGRFINTSVKNYSQGMYMRLAFAIAVHVSPDILLIDDMFMVGDLYAQRKCINKMFELKEMAKTIIFVTHDIEIVKRFCQRGILIKDGRIIKEGKFKEVTSYYLKTVGDRKGIGILQGSHLGLVFNNGKLMLSWNDDGLTKEWAGHVSVLSNGNWYSSLQADWEIRQVDRDRICLEGKCWDLPVWQLWDIRLDDAKNEIGLSIDFEVQENCNFEECKVCFMFRDDYKTWFNPFRKEVFKINDFSKELSWKRVDNQAHTANFVGLSAGDTSRALLPSVVLEDDLYIPGKLLNVQNTDCVFKARALESRIICDGTRNMSLEAGRHALFHNKVKIIDNLSEEDHYRHNAPKTILPKAIGSKEKICLTAEYHNKICIYWKGRKITASKGFKTVFYHKGEAYHSSDTVWRVHKISDNRMNIIIPWTNLPLRQVWDIELLENDIFLWKVYMQARENMVVENSEFRVMLSPQYDRWFTSEEQGEICEELKTKNYKNVIMRNDPHGIVGLKSVLSEALELPCVLLHDTSGNRFNSLDRSADINTFSEDGTRKAEPVVSLYVLDGNSEELVNFPKGSYLVCDARVLICDDYKAKGYLKDIEEKNAGNARRLPMARGLSANEIKLQSGRYKLNFVKGRGKIFLDSGEITKNFGVYTSIYSSQFCKGGVWYTSMDAIWEIIGCEKKKLIVRGRWPYLPLTQIWEIKPAHEGFTWKIDMKVHAPVWVKRQHANIMISDHYSSWSVSGGGSNLFPEEFALTQWDNLYRQKAADGLYISAGDTQPMSILPGINFSCLKEAHNLEAVIENSNVTFKSRILGFDRIVDKDKTLLEPGTYGYFYGKMSFSGK
jgi:ABC-type polysaccharide/polyol phosphate transport system ATPase subunit